MLNAKKNYTMYKLNNKLYTYVYCILGCANWQLLCDRHTIQRLFLNGEHTIQEIKREWPILLLKETIFWHFEKLVCQKITELTSTFIQEEKNFQLGIESKFTNVKCIPDEKDEKHQKCLHIIGDFFKEDVKLLIKEVHEVSEKS
jgi:hypothetical protein